MRNTLRFLDKEITVKNLSLVINEAPLIKITASELVDNPQDAVKGLDEATNSSSCIALYKHENRYIVLMGLQKVIEHSSAGGEITGHFVSKQLLKRIANMDSMFSEPMNPVISRPVPVSQEEPRSKPFNQNRPFEQGRPPYQRNQQGQQNNNNSPHNRSAPTRRPVQR